MAKRTHELGPAARGLSSSLYESAGNAGHRKPGGGQGEARRQRRAEAPATSYADQLKASKAAVAAADARDKDRRAASREAYESSGAAAQMKRERQTPSVYRQPVAKAKGSMVGDDKVRLLTDEGLPGVYRKPARKH